MVVPTIRRVSGSIATSRMMKGIERNTLTSTDSTRCRRGRPQSARRGQRQHRWPAPCRRRTPRHRRCRTSAASAQGAQVLVSQRRKHGAESPVKGVCAGRVAARLIHGARGARVRFVGGRRQRSVQRAAAAAAPAWRRRHAAPEDRRTAPCSTTRPWSSTSTRSQARRITDISCVISTTVRPKRWLMSRSSARICSVVSGSSAEVASSQARDLGLVHQRAGDADALLLSTESMAG